MANASGQYYIISHVLRCTEGDVLYCCEIYYITVTETNIILLLSNKYSKRTIRTVVIVDKFRRYLKNVYMEQKCTFILLF